MFDRMRWTQSLVYIYTIPSKLLYDNDNIPTVIHVLLTCACVLSLQTVVTFTSVLLSCPWCKWWSTNHLHPLNKWYFQCCKWTGEALLVSWFILYGQKYWRKLIWQLSHKLPWNVVISIASLYILFTLSLLIHCSHLSVHPYWHTMSLLLLLHNITVLLKIWYENNNIAWALPNF